MYAPDSRARRNWDGELELSFGHIWLDLAPGQDGGALNDEITRSYQPTALSLVDREHEQGLKEGRSGRLSPCALLGRTGSLDREGDRVTYGHRVAKAQHLVEINGAWTGSFVPRSIEISAAPHMP